MGSDTDPSGREGALKNAVWFGLSRFFAVKGIAEKQVDQTCSERRFDGIF